MSPERHPAVPGGVGIGVLTWRGYEQTRRCLESLTRLVDWPVDVVVVDNASGTGEGELLAAEFGESVSAVTLDVNGGVSTGYNAAIRWASRAGKDFVLLLNNDTEITDPALLRGLLQAAGEGVAAVGPVVVDGRGTVLSAGGRIHWLSGFCSQKRAVSTKKRGPYEVDWIDGSCMLVAIDAACRIGGLSEQYFLYWEETDWCMRVRRAGYRVLLNPSTTITHRQGGSATKWQFRFFMLRNALLFMRRNGSRFQNITSAVAFALMRVPMFIAHVSATDAGLSAAIRGVRDAVAWNLHDSTRSGWRPPADGPSVCQRSGESPADP